MAGDFVCAFSRAEFLELRKTCSAHLRVFAARIQMSALISTASSGSVGSQCGFSWKTKPLSPAQSFFSHRHQIASLLLHSLCTLNRLYPSLFA